MRVWAYICIVSACSLSVAVPDRPSLAQQTAADMLEKARVRAREIEEMKAVLSGPDQNMRLAVFDIMVKSGDQAMRDVAVDVGLASADSLLSSMALREAVLSLDRLIINVELQEDQPQKGRQVAESWLSTFGDTYTLSLRSVDRSAGTFKGPSGSDNGEVAGSMVTFKYGNDTGLLTLEDDSTLSGEVSVYRSGIGKLRARARIR